MGLVEVSLVFSNILAPFFLVSYPRLPVIRVSGLEGAAYSPNTLKVEKDFPGIPRIYGVSIPASVARRPCRHSSSFKQ
jgi:hypothetical protein